MREGRAGVGRATAAGTVRVPASEARGLERAASEAVDMVKQILEVCGYPLFTIALRACCQMGQLKPDAISTPILIASVHAGITR